MAVHYFSVNCLSCYNCATTDSWEDCNSKMTKMECPSTFTNCIKNNLTCFDAYSGVTIETYLYKTCGNKDCKAAKKNTPSYPSTFGSTQSSSYDYCCNGNNCNSGSFHKLSSALTGVFIVLILWGPHTVVY